jgi:E3 ubiquitin-protein ligase RNF213
VQITEDSVHTIIENEQKAYLDAMAEQDDMTGIATNAALKENIFVTLVCILNKIPVFIVGKPGICYRLQVR